MNGQQPAGGELTGPVLARLLEDASRADGFSLASALALADGQPPPRVGALVQRLSVQKRADWEAVSAVIHTPPPPPELNLDGLCLWEVEQAARLTAEQLAQLLPDTHTGTRLHPETRLSVAALTAQNARRTVWYASQIAALCSGPRLA